MTEHQQMIRLLEQVSIRILKNQRILLEAVNTNLPYLNSCKEAALRKTNDTLRMLEHK